MLMTAERAKDEAGGRHTNKQKGMALSGRKGEREIEGDRRPDSVTVCVSFVFQFGKNKY